MATTQIWQHNPIGELYLVRANDEGEIREACGPVTQSEAEYTIDEASGWFNDDAETREWIEAQSDHFRLK